MKAYLVWILVSSTNWNSGMVVYSPPMSTLQQCAHLHSNLVNKLMQQNSRCIQVEIMVKEEHVK